MGIMKLKCRKSIIMEEIRYVQNRYEKIREEKDILQCAKDMKEAAKIRLFPEPELFVVQMRYRYMSMNQHADSGFIHYLRSMTWECSLILKRSKDR